MVCSQLGKAAHCWWRGWSISFQPVAPTPTTTQISQEPVPINTSDIKISSAVTRYHNIGYSSGCYASSSPSTKTLIQIHRLWYQDQINCEYCPRSPSPSYCLISKPVPQQLSWTSEPNSKKRWEKNLPLRFWLKKGWANINQGNLNEWNRSTATFF